MKTAVLCVITLLATAPAFAQTSSTTSLDKTMTVTGCVAVGSEPTALTLTNPQILPGTAQPGQIDQTPSPIPTTVTPNPTEPPASATPQTAATSPAAPTTPSPTGTSGTTRTASGAVATSGVVPVTAPDASSASIVSGYRLSGADMKPWVGQRVQVTGSFAPAAPSATAPTKVTGAASAPPVLEFKVQTVQPMAGSCPK
jgi:hypothetical protein